MGAIYLATLRQLTGRWRLLVMLVLAAMPVLVTAAMLGNSHAPAVRQFELAVLSAMLAGSIAPLVVLAIAAPAFGNEVEDRTLANLVLSPLPRWQIVVPKLLATLSIAGPFVLASALVTSWMAYLGDPRAMLAVSLACLAAVALYAAAFLWLGLSSPQAIGLGLLYVVLWEGFFSGFVAGVRALSIRYHAISLMHAIDPRRFADAKAEPPSVAVAGAIALLVLAGFLLLTVRKLRRMDVP
jgi:ABC-2 type transport system permease protein